MAFLPGTVNNIVDLSTDSHIHTRLCNHASGEMEDYVLSAIDSGLKTIIFLEHLEAEIIYCERTWLAEADFAYYFDEGSRLKKKYRDRLAIQLGIEVGFNPLAIDKLQEKITGYPCEYIGLSYHFFFNGTRHLNLVSRKKENITQLAALGTDTVISHYFAGLIQGITELDCNVLCHLDAVMRHYPGLQFNASHMNQIDHILGLLEEKRMHLEINTSGFAVRNEPYPGKIILKKAIAMNIPLMAGSDAHHPKQVGRYFDRLPGLLAQLR